MKHLYKVIVAMSIAMGLLALAPAVAGAQYYNYGRTPSLSVSQQGNGNFQVNVSNADPLSSVTLYARNQGSSLWSTVIDPLGQTDSNGYFSTSQNFGLSSTGNAEFYVKVNGAQSSTVTAGYNNNNNCYNNCSGSFPLSQTNVSLNVGQSQAVTAYNYSNSNLYISSNSNSSVASATVSGSTINIYGLSSGSTNISVCANSSSQCATIYVVVNGGNGGCTYNCGSISFSQNNVSLNLNQSSTITVYGNNNNNYNYYISSNSNQSAVTDSLSGSSLYLYGQNTGNSTITVCQSGNSSCGTVYVTVNGNNNGNVTFSNSNPNLIVGQNLAISIYSTYNTSNSYYVSANTSSSIVTANTNGNTLNLYGQSSGNSTITVCQSVGNSCGTLYVTVSGSGGSSNISFSPTNPNLNVGQNLAVSVYSNNNNNSSYYVSSNSNSAAVTASISGSILNLYGQNNGSSSIVVCQNSYSACGTLYVTVSGNNNNNGSLYFSGITLPNVSSGQYYNYQLQASGGTAPYYYYITSGNLPNGLSLNSNGLISGTAYNVYSSSFTVKVNDNYGHTATANFTINTGSVLGSNTYANGQLISENGTVYLVYKNMKTGFTNADVFNYFGFSFANVINAGYSGLNNSGYVIRSTNTSHPWGSWIKNGSTVYFVDQTGLIPVASYDVFINNGGRDNLVVPANIYDFRLPMLSVMVMGDYRLR